MTSRPSPSGSRACRLLGPLGLGLFVFLGLWACDGRNLFGPGIGVEPRIVDLDVPTAVDSGDDLVLSVRAVGAVRVDSVAVRAVVGDSDQMEVIPASEDALEVWVEAVFTVPSVITDTLITATAWATDAQGNVSPAADRTIRAIDRAPPAVSITLFQNEVGLGEELDIEVGAQDNIGLTRIGFQFLGEDGEPVTEVLENVEGRTASRMFTFTIPEDLGPGDFVVQGWAEDLAGNRGTVPADQLLRVVVGDA